MKVVWSSISYWFPNIKLFWLLSIQSHKNYSNYKLIYIKYGCFSYKRIYKVWNWQIEFLFFIVLFSILSKFTSNFIKQLDLRWIIRFNILVLFYNASLYYHMTHHYWIARSILRNSLHVTCIGRTFWFSWRCNQRQENSNHLSNLKSFSNFNSSWTHN